jgi:hypothetical protein
MTTRKGKSTEQRRKGEIPEKQRDGLQGALARENLKGNHEHKTCQRIWKKSLSENNWHSNSSLA